jgi:hypothetical protein
MEKITFVAVSRVVQEFHLRVSACQLTLMNKDIIGKAAAAEPGLKAVLIARAAGIPICG